MACFDPTELVEKDVQAQLDEDPDHMVILQGTSGICTSQERLSENQEDNDFIQFECQQGHYVGQYIKIVLSDQSVLVPSKTQEDIVLEALRGSRRLQLYKTPTYLERTATGSVAQMQPGSGISGAHCQEGTGRQVYFLSATQTELVPQNLLDITPWFHQFMANHQPWWIRVQQSDGRSRNLFLPLRWDNESREWTRLSVENAIRDLPEFPDARRALDAIQKYLQSLPQEEFLNLDVYNLHIQPAVSQTIRTVSITRDNPSKYRSR